MRKRSSGAGQPNPNEPLTIAPKKKKVTVPGYLAGFMGPQPLDGALKRFDKHIRCLRPGLAVVLSGPGTLFP